MADNSFGIASYNMHGINSGCSGLLDLCNNKNIHIIVLQEHWLHDSNLYLMNSIHPEFVSLCISSMSERLHMSVYYGRPYGSVGFLVRKSLYDRCKVGARAVSGRCGLSSLTAVDRVRCSPDCSIHSTAVDCGLSSPTDRKAHV